MSYIDYPVKCMACGLHYTVHSYNDDWHGTEGGTAKSKTNGGVCPECGVIGGKILFAPVKRDGQIYEVVGNTSPSEITAQVAMGVGMGAATMRRLIDEGRGA